MSTRLLAAAVTVLVLFTTSAHAADKNMVRLWQTATGKELWRLEKHDGGADVAFSPDGRTLATSGRNPLLWEVATGKERHQFRGHDGHVTSVSFSPDGRLLASSSWEDRTALVWDLTGGIRGGAPVVPLSAAQLQRHWEAIRPPLRSSSTVRTWSPRRASRCRRPGTS